MKKTIFILIAFCLGIFGNSCSNFEELNENPNALTKTSDSYYVSYLITNYAKQNRIISADAGAYIPCAMQYYADGDPLKPAEKNAYEWTRDGGNHPYNNYYNYLRTNKTLYENGVNDNNPAYQAIALTMKSLMFGDMTDLYGDIPYSEALQNEDGIKYPKYDMQKDIYEGILTDLRTASELIEGLPAGSTLPMITDCDLFYDGSRDKWLRFINSIRLRYCMRLNNKKAELDINIESEFKDAATKAFTNASDDAVLHLLGTNSDNSSLDGPINSGQATWRAKIASTMVNALKERNDPRLYRFVSPVETKRAFGITEEYEMDYTDILGQNFQIEVIPTSDPSVDTSLYVGLPPGISNGDAVKNFNKGDSPDFSFDLRSPYISYFGPYYFENANDYVSPRVISYSEVKFIMAEAATLGLFGVTNAEDHYKEGIRASMESYGIFKSAGDKFSFDNYYNQSNVNYAQTPQDKRHELVMTQKWISSWCTAESWYDWRRTGLPNLVPAASSNYKVMPIRYYYVYPSPPDPEYLENYKQAVGRLEYTHGIQGEVDNQYSRMWLLQGTNKPY
ncbi:MAG: SusD/RagB family nutrient-binding outer membrane lipoprotein [Draconibacterium sp.]